MTTILGIDPGSRNTGYGLISTDGHRHLCLAHGHIPAAGDGLAERLHEIFESLAQVIRTHQPEEVAIEQVFTCRNHQSALKLGQARGAALVACAQYALPVFEYSPKTIKQAVVGHGSADKAQVQHMVRSLLNLKHAPQVDAADGLAIALCHCHSRRLTQQFASAEKKTTR